MASERKTGLGALPAGLLRPTTPPEPAEPADPGEDAGGDGAQGRGGASGEARAAAPRTRRKRPPVGGETRGRKLHLPDEIHDRLWLLARQRKATVSAVAAELLDRALPRFTVTREG
jgi:hypothetical protein